MTDPVKPEPDQLQAKIDQLSQLLETQRTSQDARAQETAERLAHLQGQLSTILVPSGTVQEPAVELDGQALLNDPTKTLDAHWEKRAKPLIDSQLQREAATQRELVGLKRKTDWEKYGKEVEGLAQAGRISAEVLAQPGTYERLLDVIKSRHVDEIVEARVKDEVGKFQAEAARSAAASTPGPSGSAPTKAEDVSFDPSQLSVMEKMGVDPKRAAEISKDVSYDGVRLVGRVH